MKERAGRVVMLGFDAMDPAITEQLASQGTLEAFRRLFGSAARCPVRNPPGLYVGSLWSTFFTGRSAVETGFHCWEEIVPGGYERRLTTAASIRGRPFWEAISDAGRRIVVLDVPHSRAGAPVNGVQVSEWGCHDRHFGLRTHPPELAEELVARFGLHPVLGDDPFSVREWAPDDYVFRSGPIRTAEEDRVLVAALLEGAETKRRLSNEILAAEDWDLFLSVFGEPHSMGHQAWHLHDPSHPRHDPGRRDQIGDPLHDLYAVMDRALGDAMAQLSERDTLLVLLSHGMGPHYGGTHLLPAILRRLDAAYRAGPERSLEGRTLGRAWSAAPTWARSVTVRPLAGLLRMRLARRRLRPPEDLETADERRTRDFFTSPNNDVIGGVRVNLKGRESHGRVNPGHEFDDLCRRIEADLLALVNIESGQPVVKRVQRSDAYYQRAQLDALPDLFVEWNAEHPIEAVWSPRFGMIRRPYTHWRTGDHKPGGLLLARGPGIAAGSESSPVEVHRLGTMIAGRLGVELPGGDIAAEPSFTGVAD